MSAKTLVVRNGTLIDGSGEACPLQTTLSSLKAKAVRSRV